ncbi:MAG TPA: NYN domain-containing protein [Pyrinomonadaceae bacterium]|jgi:uncharacterized LabA/DUF88 family protein|nr:NYN domain-containing protein [Pyrinomonadaceae bacterium]
MTQTRGKTICFIDDQNVYHGQRDNGWRIDWQKFIKLIEQDGDELWQVYYFGGEKENQSEGEANYYNFLKEKLRWEIYTYPLGKRTVSCVNCNHTHTLLAEKGVDVGLAIKMLTLGINKAYETAILVSGDRDYLEAVQFVKGLGLRVEVVSWRDGLSDALSAESSAPVVYFDDLEKKIGLK